MLNCIVDFSHWNNLPENWPDLCKQAGILGVILKATQGEHGTDPTFRARLEQAKCGGLLVGAYHFGAWGDGRVQAGHFLAAVGETSNVLLALDIEENTSGQSMDLVQAYDFVNRVNAVTGRWPVLYGGAYLRGLLVGEPDAILNQCPLWLADYRATPQLIPGWEKFTIWQHTDRGEVEGIGPCDRDIFNGDADALKGFWPSKT
jgi:lysozyme